MRMHKKTVIGIIIVIVALAGATAYALVAQPTKDVMKKDSSMEKTTTDTMMKDEKDATKATDTTDSESSMDTTDHMDNGDSMSGDSMDAMEKTN